MSGEFSRSISVQERGFQTTPKERLTKFISKYPPYSPQFQGLDDFVQIAKAENVLERKYPDIFGTPRSSQDLKDLVKKSGIDNTAEYELWDSLHAFAFVREKTLGMKGYTLGAFMGIIFFNDYNLHLREEEPETPLDQRIQKTIQQLGDDIKDITTSKT